MSRKHRARARMYRKLGLSLPAWVAIGVGVVILVGLVAALITSSVPSRAKMIAPMRAGATKTSTLVTTEALPTATDEPTPVPSLTQAPSPTALPTRSSTPTPTSTATSTPTSTATPRAVVSMRTSSPTPTLTSTPTPEPTPTATLTPTPTARWFPAPTPLAPENGVRFSGWDAQVILEWSSVGELAADEYYVVRIPYDDAGGVGEFWRKETSLQVHTHYSSKDVGFPDRHYDWSVQVMRCTDQCDRALDDNVHKQGVSVGDVSGAGMFYWYHVPTSRPANECEDYCAISP